ncbi:MAG: glycosyltransferase family 9 protein [Planctomycetota bacterium]
MKLLLIRLSALGDVVHSLGAVEALARERPDLQIHFLVQQEFAPLLDGLDFIHAVISHRRRPAVRGYLQTVRHLRQLAPEIAVDLQGNWKSAGLARLSGAPRRIGAPRRERREPSSGRLINEFAAKSDPPHPSRQAMAMLRLLGRGIEPRLPRLRADADELERETEALAEVGIDARRPFRVLVVSDENDPRAWPRSAMLREAEESTLPTLFLVGPAESGVELGEEICCLEHGPGAIRRLVALAVLVARAGGEVLGPDRGATHVLAGAGADTKVFFGPQDPRLTAPPAATVLRSKRAPECVPCRKRRCHHPEGPICMDFSQSEAEDLGRLP